MIRVTFEEDTKANVLCKSTDENMHFIMNQDHFENRECRFAGTSLLFDGYSIWFKEDGDPLKKSEGFSLSFLFAPYGYSDQGDGLFSCFDMEKREGFYVLLEKQGKLQVGFGNGREVFLFHSVNSKVMKSNWNIVTVVFWEEAGWCDLYVNGVLSNRKQFPRHMQLKWPTQEAYIGKHVDHAGYHENSPVGIFYGLMNEVLLHDEPLNEKQVKALHGTYPAGEPAERIPLNRKAYSDDVQRPKYHLIAPGKWMNEPHGPLFYEGYYHIFYQANPHAPIWNHIQWGHMVSRDMIHWEDLPLALETGDDDLDPDGCWSGSSLIDKEGIPRIFYTAGNNNKFPNQFVAMAKAEIDPEKKLPKWIKHSAPIVEQTKGWMGEFRDPFVWLEKDTYFMLVGTGDADNGGGNAVLYSSKDLLDWQCHGFFLDYDYGKNMEIGHVFELPVILPLRDESGEIVCHIFLVCGCQIEGDVVENFGFLGNWDPDGKRFRKFHEKALLLDLGHGMFTGPSGLVTPDKRSVVFTIAQGMRNGKDAYHAGWDHNGGLPVELSIKGGELHISPIREIYQLKQKKLLHLKDISLKEANLVLSQFKGNCFWMRVQAEASMIAIETLDGERKKSVYYDRPAKHLGITDETGKELGKYRGEEDRVDIGACPIVMEYFLDHSMIEVFLNERKSLTHRNYIQGTERKLLLDGKVERIMELELWEMGTAY